MKLADLVGKLDSEETERQESFKHEYDSYAALFADVRSFSNAFYQASHIEDLFDSYAPSFIKSLDIGQLFSYAPACYALLADDKEDAERTFGILVSQCIKRLGPKSVHIPKSLNYLCNTFEGGFVKLTGKIGHQAFNDMQKGIVSVESDVGDCCAEHMEGGQITIQGNTGWRCGVSMTGGTINLYGEVGHDVGCGSSGGNIHLFGKTEPCLGWACKARVYWQGKRIN